MAKHKTCGGYSTPYWCPARKSFSAIPCNADNCAMRRKQRDELIAAGKIQQHPQYKPKYTQS